jgi:hypothetical protein
MVMILNSIDDTDWSMTTCKWLMLPVGCLRITQVEIAATEVVKSTTEAVNDAGICQIGV